MAIKPLMISPLDHSLPGGWSRPAPSTWLFAGHTHATLTAFFGQLALAGDQGADLLNFSRWKVETGGIRVFPKNETILSLDPASRVAIYAELSKHPDNKSYHQPWSVKKETFDRALEGVPLSPETRQSIRRVAYEKDNRVFVADASAVVSAVVDETEKLQVLRFLKSAETFVVQLKVDTGAGLSAQHAYWSNRPDQKEIRPILESIAYAAGSNQLDIIHMLPDFARRLLYAYPGAATPETEVRRDCHWTSLNFFNAVPDDRLGNTAYVQEHVLENYFQSVDAPAFGDIIFYTTQDGQTVHSSVYLAGDLVFTKNGDDIHQPWIIMDIADLESLYSAYHHATVTRQTWKRKGGEKNPG